MRRIIHYGLILVSAVLFCDLSGLYAQIQANPEYMYSVVEIKNAAYAEVETLLTPATISSLNNNSQTEAKMETQITNVAPELRNALPQAMVSSYTYKPLVGMTSKTDARGIIETYKYDGMQRLQAILDQVGNVTKAIDYHYRPN